MTHWNQFPGHGQEGGGERRWGGTKSWNERSFLCLLICVVMVSLLPALLASSTVHTWLALASLALSSFSKWRVLACFLPRKKVEQVSECALLFFLIFFWCLVVLFHTMALCLFKSIHCRHCIHFVIKLLSHNPGDKQSTKRQKTPWRPSHCPACITLYVANLKGCQRLLTHLLTTRRAPYLVIVDYSRRDLHRVLSATEALAAFPQHWGRQWAIISQMLTNVYHGLCCGVTIRRNHIVQFICIC